MHSVQNAGCIFLSAEMKKHSIMGTANDKFYDATHDNLDGDTQQAIHQVSHQDSTPSAAILRLIPYFQFAKSESSGGEANISFSPHSVKSLYFVSVHPMQKQQKPDMHPPPDAYVKTHNMPLHLKYSVKNALSFSNGMMSI